MYVRESYHCIILDSEEISDTLYINEGSPSHRLIASVMYVLAKQRREIRWKRK